MSSATVTPREPKSEQEVLGTYRQMQSEMQGLIQNLTKIEMDRNEHRLVEETLTPLDPDRRAFRLVGGVLVERTVREVEQTTFDPLNTTIGAIRNNDNNEQQRRDIIAS
eukprot:CAMPEP_0201622754 /NCGR_PEP_ID=MMETSP0492-20130828/47564_1 /ASSEMBLY_ACC=CAM_ASM_000837 /TAXON_ID=420259 /ORGANISM="Thalassiosira gravida, Strain GMp14c1" /LENGTH=108 /DNA_ID=CAMNT_0048092345 /DNA_START=236 /DNA_END=562 /DNA_ORIENTATION=-